MYIANPNPKIFKTLFKKNKMGGLKDVVVLHNHSLQHQKLDPGTDEKPKK